MPWVRGSENPKQKWVSIKHCAEHFDCSKSKLYELMKEPKYKDVFKRTEVGIRVNLPFIEKLIIGG